MFCYSIIFEGRQEPLSEKQKLLLNGFIWSKWIATMLHFFEVLHEEFI